MEKKLKPLDDILVESLSPDMGYYFRTSKVIFKTRTEFQDLEVHEFKDYGRVLRLDGVFQTSDRDEFLYHEPLTHVAGIAMDGPKRALVIGGGDGGAAEEFLKYKDIEKVVMVELDKGVVDASIDHIPSISKDAFKSPKLDLRIEDGIKYIQETNEKFDQVLLDLTDPFGPSAMLYTKEFYSDIARILTPNGAVSLHIESPITRPSIYSGLFWTLKSVFKNVRPMLNYVPLYGTLWGFAIASQNLDPMDISKEEIKKRIENHGLTRLQFYNENTHFSLMSLPNYVLDLIKDEKEPYTLSHSPNVESLIVRNLKMAVEE